MILPRHIRIEDISHAGEARRAAESLCRQIGFDQLLSAKVCLVATEITTNLVKHTQCAGGDLFLIPIESDGLCGLDILALDHGPGIVNLQQSLLDGYSTTGTQGSGLGAIRRQSVEFDIYSVPTQGAALISRFWSRENVESKLGMQAGSVCMPVKGESVCGDAWSMKSTGESCLVMLVDGLGHGPQAAEAAQLAVTVFQGSAQHRPGELLLTISKALGATRGAAVGIAEIALGQQKIYYSGIGNISAAVFGEDKYFNLISHNGIVGMEPTLIREFEYTWPEIGFLVMHSDGLAPNWSLDQYPGLSQKHPTLIAGALFRDYRIIRDDCCILVAKPNRWMMQA